MSSASRPKIPMRDVHLAFGVSLDEEYVTLHATCGSTTHDVTSRVPKYVLLMVARQRLADAAAGLPDQDCGWVEQDRLATDAGWSDLRFFPAALFKIRFQFAELPILDPDNIVERHPSKRTVRIGTARLSIEAL
jgi:hypothetical protein